MESKKIDKRNGKLTLAPLQFEEAIKLLLKSKPEPKNVVSQPSITK